MDIAREESLVGRVDRENCRWRVIAGAAAAFLGLLLLVGATGDKLAEEIRARRFVLVGSDGKDRASLSEEPDGEVRLVLMDKDGKLRAGWSVLADGSPRLTLYHVNGEEGINVKLTQQGSSVLKFYGPAGKVRAVMGVAVVAGGDGIPVFGLTESDGTDLTLAGYGLGITDKDEKRRARLWFVNGSPILTLWDKDGKVIWEAP